MTEAVVPRYDLVRLADYLLMGIQFSRGCPYHCEFCNVIELLGRRSRVKTVQQLIKELQFLHQLGHRGHVFFIDDNFLANRKQTQQLLIEIKKWSKSNKHPFYFAANASINLAGDDRLLQLMKEAEFRHISIGIETPDDDVLKLAQKEHNMNLPIVELIKKIYSYGIAVDASFILGFDNETEQTARMMMNCIQESCISSCSRTTAESQSSAHRRSVRDVLSRRHILFQQ